MYISETDELNNTQTVPTPEKGRLKIMIFLTLLLLDLGPQECLRAFARQELT